MIDLDFDGVKWIQGQPHAHVLTGSLSIDSSHAAATNGFGLEPLGGSAVQVVFASEGVEDEHAKKIRAMKNLPAGWNGYAAPPPSRTAIGMAEGYVKALERARFKPSRIAPSAVGGVGVTHKKSKRRVYVEFFNEGEVCVLFSDGEDAPKSRRIEARYAEFRKLIREIQDYLDA